MNDINELWEMILAMVLILGKHVMAWLDDLGELGLIVVFILIPIALGIVFSIFCERGNKK